MPARYHAELFTLNVLDAQRRYATGAAVTSDEEPPDALGPVEAEFIAERDSFYLATSSSSGWPYVQHRGGPPGFVRVLDEHTLAFPDFRGNRQLISTGNLAAGGRASLIMVDYPARTRLKLLAHARVAPVQDDPALAERLGVAGAGRKVERLVVLDVVAFDWNCAAYITPRHTLAEIEAWAAPLRARIVELEAELAARPATARHPR